MKKISRNATADSNRAALDTVQQWLRRTRTNLPRVQPVFEFICYRHYRKSGEFALHQHANYEVVAVERGQYRCWINDCELRLGGGDVVVVEPGDWHRDAYAAGLRLYGFNFNLEPAHAGVSTPLFARGIAPNLKMFHADRQYLRPIFKRLLRESKSSDRFAGAIQDALLLELFWKLARSLPASALGPHFVQVSASAQFLGAFEGVIRENLKLRVSVAELAASLNLSESALAHKCKDLLGTSPARALMKCKLIFARRMLAEPGTSVKAVAAELNFSDPYHFSKVYKRQFGSSPSDHRSRP